MRRLSTYNRLSSSVQSNDDWHSSEDNLLTGADCTSYSSAVRVGYLVRHILNQHIKYYDYRQWENEQDPTPFSTTSGAAQRGTTTKRTTTAIATTTTTTTTSPTPPGNSPPSKLSKMWKRVKRVFGGGRRRQQINLINEENHATSSSASDAPFHVGSATMTPLVQPPALQQQVAMASTSATPNVVVSAERSPTSGRKLELPYVYCGRYTNPGFILKQHSSHISQNRHHQGQCSSTVGPSFNSIKNGNIEEVDMRVKVEAWVAHLGNPTAKNLTKALMASEPPKKCKGYGSRK